MEENIKISILTRSKMMVEIDGKILFIQGEATITPAFYAEIASIKHWEKPYEEVVISEDEKRKIINKVIEKTKNGPIKVYFD